ncbi:MAG: twin-arginine translocation signal domain-containing protein [Planctomycetes bacterium]|nr:twin-arginine translocation signal domain-containing protein [Planctomycetota bacterium]
MTHTRRDFIKTLSATAAVAFILPSFTSCTTSGGSGNGGAARATDPLALPSSKPADWDAISFNMQRALAGAAPESYHGSISGEGGDKKHVGKHTPFAPSIKDVPEGYVAVMFGDDSKSYPKHPNSDTHWYDWVSIRKSSAGTAEEVTSKYGAWPSVTANDNGKYAAQGKDIKENGGRGTVYLAKLPADVKKGDLVRIVGHCKKHGDWVNFVSIA